MIVTLSREVEGHGPMKPGNRLTVSVPIPTGYLYVLEDEEKIITSSF
jgi:hypothetical protein